MRFIELRFRPGIQVEDDELERELARRAQPGSAAAPVRDELRAQVEQQMIDERVGPATGAVAEELARTHQGRVPGGGVAVRRRWKIALIVAGSVAGLMLVLAVSAVLVARSDWFHELVRERIVREVENATGGRAEIGRFSFDLAAADRYGGRFRAARPGAGRLASAVPRPGGSKWS